MQAVESWRAWRVYGGGNNGPPMLWSITEPVYWPPREEFVATCSKHPSCCEHSEEGVPGKDCHCGVYSMKTLAHLQGAGFIDHGGRHPLTGATFFYVIGRLASWGKVIEAERGYRAEKSYPQSLFLPERAMDRLAVPLEKDYGVPVQSALPLSPALQEA